MTTEVAEETKPLTGLTVAEAEKLDPTDLLLCIGNIGCRVGEHYRIARVGSIVHRKMIDPAMLTKPVSPAHPNLPAVAPLAEGLAILAERRRTWDPSRQPKLGQTLTLQAEIERWYPNWAPPVI